MHENLDYLRSTSISDPQLDEVPIPTYVVITDDQASLAINRIAEYFGADRTRRTVRLRLGDEDRYPYRDALLSAYGGGTRRSGRAGACSCRGTTRTPPSMSFGAPSLAARTAPSSC